MGDIVFRFQKLDIYELALDLVKDSYSLTSTFPMELACQSDISCIANCLQTACQSLANDSKRILITGANSYVGISFEKWLAQWPEKYIVDTVDMIDGSWREKSFSGYDVVFHVAGIAYVSADPAKEGLYYRINRDLAIETAEKAKADSVRQFIFMSSIIVYGENSDSKRVIGRNTIPAPNNFYGMSKLQAEEGIIKIKSDAFKVLILRPPMVYGKGSKGNYPKLSGLAVKTPVFPDFDNQRSMLHIDNLCEFLRVMIDHEESGLFFPQNGEYVKTSEMVRLIAEAHGKKICMTKLFNPLIRAMFSIKAVKKVFGSLVYDKSMSNYRKGNYQIRNLKESIEYTERENDAG